MNQFIKEQMLIGKEAIEKLKTKKVAIFGLGGVGSFVVEALSRACIGNFVLIDNDKVEKSNMNRQLIALFSTMGKEKVEVCRERILDINPNANIKTYNIFYSKDSGKGIIKGCDYVIDAIDSVGSKIELIKECSELGIPIISSMGTGNKLKPEMFEIDDIYNTSICPLCRIIRHELRKIGIKELKVLYSKESPIQVDYSKYEEKGPASISFVPSTAGLRIAGEVIKQLIK